MARYAADFSKWQKNIDASKFKNEILFGIIRVQAGYTHEDTKHKDYEQQFLKNGIPFGEYAYGLYISVSDAVAEAKSFLNRINKSVPKNKLRLAVDVEENDCKVKSQLVSATQAFVNTVKAAGYECGIYSGAYFFNVNHLNTVKCDFRWIASYALHDNGTPQFKPTIPYDLWQFSSKGHLDGVTGYVDLNLPASDSVTRYFTGENTDSVSSSAKTKWYTNYTSVDLNVRSGRGTNYGVVLTLPKGSKVSYMGGSTKNGWGYIHYTNSRKVTYRGYVSMQFLTRTNSVPVKKQSSSANKTVVTKYYKDVVTDNLNVRTGRGTNYSVIMVLPKGSKVSYMSGSTKNGWGYIKYTNSKKQTFSGYVFTKYLKLETSTKSESKPVAKWYTNYVTDNLNVRSGRGTNNRIIVTLPKGSKVSYMGGSTKNGWGYIHYTNSRNKIFRGYVVMRYLSRKEPVKPKKVSYKTHTVVAGDSLSKIALEYHTTVQNIAKLNGFTNINRIIYPGMKLKV